MAEEGGEPREKFNNFIRNFNANPNVTEDKESICLKLLIYNQIAICEF